MIRAYMRACFDAACIALIVGTLIALAAIGCDVTKQTRFESHSVQGIRSSSLSR